jgi:hypothetical protein
MDTGSSDTFVFSTTVNCTDSQTKAPVSQGQCGISGPRYNVDGSFVPISYMHLNASYGNGAAIDGRMGYTRIEFAGLAVPKQEISAITYASWGGFAEGNVSGLLGLAYASLTSAYPGPAYPDVSDGCLNGTCGPISYSPFLQTLFDSGISKPVFSFAISRSNRSGGLMTLGGIPDLHDGQVNVTTGSFTTIPIKPLKQNSTVLGAYAIDVDSLVYTGASGAAGQGRYIGELLQARVNSIHLQLKINHSHYPWLGLESPLC